MSKLNILVAYPYMKKELVNELFKRKNEIRFALDSGAFTAWRSGKPIQLDDYCRFIESLPFEPWRYFSLDVIGDPSGSMKNYEKMLSRGFKPIPIFTRGEDPSVLDDYYKTSDVVGIGGLVGTPGNKGFVKGIMKHVGDRKVHWLGFTSYSFVKHYRPYMCDSSSWECTAKYGYLLLYAGNGEFFKTDYKDLKKNKEKILKCFKEINFSEKDFSLDKKRWRGGNSVQRVLAARSIVKFSTDLERVLNVKQFMALTTKNALSLLFNQKDLLLP